MADTLRQLAELGCSCITSFLPIAWSLEGVLPHYAIDAPSKLLARSQEMLQVDELLTDELSKERVQHIITPRQEV